MARAVLAQAVEAEVPELAKHVDLKNASGSRRERGVVTGIGPVGERQSRVRAWCRRRCRAHPLHAGGPAALCAALPSGSTAARPRCLFLRAYATDVP
jgi:hypothetical protein